MNKKILRASLFTIAFVLISVNCQDIILSTEDEIYGDSMQGVYADEIQKYIEEEMISLPSYVKLDEPIIEISVGGYFTIALTQSRKVYQWGIGRYDQKTPIQFPDNVTISHVIAGDYHALAITTDGQVFSWGRNNKLLGSVKLLGDDPYIPQLISGSLRNKNIVSAGIGLDHALFLTENGKVYTIGDGTKGQTGLVHLFAGTAEEKTKYSPVLIKSSALDDLHITSVCCGSEHSLVLADNGDVFSFGSGAYGKLGTGEAGDTAMVTKIEGLSNIAMISCGGDHSLAVDKEGSLWAWGWNEHGQLGAPLGSVSLLPQKIVLNNVTIASIEAGKYAHSLLVTNDGKLYTFGWNENGQLGFGDARARFVPSEVSGLSSIVQAGAGYKHTVVLDKDGILAVFGDDMFGQLGTTHEEKPSFSLAM